jgi:hypothetical protein
MTANNPTNDLGEYLHRRLQYLDRCNAEIESKLSDDERNLCGKIDDGAYSKNDPSVGQIIFHLEYVVGNTFRYTMLVGVCSFLEEAIKAISKRLVADYEAKIKAPRKGTWLWKHICVLSGCVSLDLAPIQSDLDTFQDLITLRNCVVHAWGRIAEANDPDAVKAAAERIETAAVSADGFLIFGDQVVPDAIIAAENIAEHVLTSKLQTSMT